MTKFFAVLLDLCTSVIICSETLSYNTIQYKIIYWHHKKENPNAVKHVKERRKGGLIAKSDLFQTTFVTREMIIIFSIIIWVVIETKLHPIYKTVQCFSALCCFFSVLCTVLLNCFFFVRKFELKKCIKHGIAPLSDINRNCIFIRFS